MAPRRTGWLLWLAGIALVLCLTTMGTAEAVYQGYDRGPGGGGGQQLDPPGGPGGPGGGDGGDPDEFFLSVGPEGPTIIADDGEDRSGTRDDLPTWPKRVYWLVELFFLIS